MAALVQIPPLSPEALAALRSAVCKGASTSNRTPHNIFTLCDLLDAAVPVQPKKA